MWLNDMFTNLRDFRLSKVSESTITKSFLLISSSVSLCACSEKSNFIRFPARFNLVRFGYFSKMLLSMYSSSTSFIQSCWSKCLFRTQILWKRSFCSVLLGRDKSFMAILHLHRFNWYTSNPSSYAHSSVGQFPSRVLSSSVHSKSAVVIWKRRGSTIR
jgi:hypothetical protein